jgi:hypothetical protein
MVDLLDVVATIREIAGVDGERWGRSLLRPSATLGVVFANFGYIGLRTDELTITWAKTGAPLEVYDRGIDPHQYENVVEDRRYLDRVRAGWAHVLRER